MKTSRITLILTSLAIALSSVSCAHRTYWGVEGDVPGGPHYYAGQNYRSAPPRSDKKAYKKWQKEQRKWEKEQAKRCKAARKEYKRHHHHHHHHHGH